MLRSSPIGKGFCFGLLLQAAIGPVCLFVLNSAIAQGFFTAFAAISAVVLADALMITISLLGASLLFRKRRFAWFSQILGGFVLIIFGLDMVLNVFGVKVVPGFTLFQVNTAMSLFLQTLLLTLSNPLTILFWGGVLASKVAENEWTRAELVSFAFGCVLATGVFMTLIAALGGFVVVLLPPIILQGLNIAVGAVICGYGVRLLLHRFSPVPLSPNSTDHENNVPSLAKSKRL